MMAALEGQKKKDTSDTIRWLIGHGRNELWVDTDTRALFTADPLLIASARG